MEQFLTAYYSGVDSGFTKTAAPKAAQGLNLIPVPPNIPASLAPQAPSPSVAAASESLQGISAPVPGEGGGFLGDHAAELYGLGGGALLGAGAGALASRENRARNALIGALLGGGAGVGVGRYLGQGGEASPDTGMLDTGTTGSEGSDLTFDDPHGPKGVAIRRALGIS